MSYAKALIQLALKPGVDLSHYPHACAVDGLHALGRARHPLARLLIHARMGEFDLPKLVEATKTVIEAVAARDGWHVNDRRNHTRSEVLTMIAQQVVSEYIGAPCQKCRGRGLLGDARGSVRHSLEKCAACGGTGDQPRVYVTRHYRQGPKRRLSPRRPCVPCQGKGVTSITREAKASKVRPCDACAGAGSQPDSTRARGKALDYDHSLIVKVWGVRLNAVLAELRAIERSALRGVARNVRDL